MGDLYCSSTQELNITVNVHSETILLKSFGSESCTSLKTFKRVMHVFVIGNPLLHPSFFFFLETRLFETEDYNNIAKHAFRCSSIIIILLNENIIR